MEEKIFNAILGIYVLLIVFAFPIGFFVLLKKWRNAKKELKELLRRLNSVIEGDSHTASQHVEPEYAEADDYSTSRHVKADAYFTTKCVEADELIRTAQEKLNAVKNELTVLSKERSNLLTELQTLELDVVTGMVRIDAYDDLKSDEIKNELALLKVRQDTMVKDSTAVVITAAVAPKKVITSQVKQILRCFNAECANILGGVTVKNVDTSRAKIQRSFDAINKVFVIDGVQIAQAYLASKFEELSLIYAYMVKEEEEREQRRAIREQMVEEEKVRREIEREKQKIEKETTQFTNEVNKLMAYMQKARDDVERQLYIEKINELQAKLKVLEADKENVLQRERNTRAGFVYIISNIGSFGEHIYKIGMTRRLEPMDRISELSSASVPFPFDVHAMIFSEDAPGLESILHQFFSSMRVNKVNPRKEFFQVDLDAIKKVVLENHNATVKFVDIPDAVEYRETLKLSDRKELL